MAASRAEPPRAHLAILPGERREREPRWWGGVPPPHHRPGSVLVLLRLALREGPLVLVLGVIVLVGLARRERALVVRFRRVLGLLTLGEAPLVVLVLVGRFLALGEVAVRPVSFGSSMQVLLTPPSRRSA